MVHICTWDMPWEEHIQVGAAHLDWAQNICGADMNPTNPQLEDELQAKW